MGYIKISMLGQHYFSVHNRKNGRKEDLGPTSRLLLVFTESFLFNRSGVDWGVSDHHTANIFFENISVRWWFTTSSWYKIGSIVVLLNHLGIFFGWNFHFLLLFRVVSCLKTLFLDFHQEKFSCNADIQTGYCPKSHLLTRPT